MDVLGFIAGATLLVLLARVAAWLDRVTRRF